MFCNDPEIRAYATAHMTWLTASVLLWGEGVARADMSPLIAVECTLSTAAVLYKRHALAALAMSFPVSPHELFARAPEA